MGRTLLEKWLSQRVGYCVKLSASDVGSRLYDGKVFYDLLRSYGLVNVDKLSCLPGKGKKTPAEAFMCLAQLCDAFHLLQINVGKEYLMGIANQHGPSAVRLLYQLYLSLEGKQFLDLITPKKSEAGNIEESIAHKRCFHPKELIDEEGAEKEMSIVKQYDEARKRILKQCAEDIAKRRGLLNRIQHPPIDFRASGEPTHLNKHEETREEGNEEFEEYVENIKMRGRKRLNKGYQAVKPIPELVMKDIQTDIPERINGISKSSFKTRMYQQSEFEQSQALKWSGAHHKLKLFYETAQDKYVESNEEAAGEKHEVKNEILRRGGEEIGKKQEATWALHRKLWAEKLTRRRQKNFEMARYIVQDLIAVLMKILLYRYEHKREPVPRRIMNDWKEAFFYGSLTTCPPSKVNIEDSLIGEETYDEGNILLDVWSQSELDNEAFTDREEMEQLNEFDTHCYLYLVGPWDRTNWPQWEEIEDENLTVNGFIVHRLLETKYPLPKGYQNPEFNFQYKSALSPIKDPNTAYIYSAMRNLLSKQGVVTVDVIDSMKYCLNTYHAEMASIEEHEETDKAKMDLNSQSKQQTRSSTKRKSVRKSQVRRSKAGSDRKRASSKQTGGRKSMGAKSGMRKSFAGGRKSIAGKNKKLSQPSRGSRGSLKGIKREHKEVQCPSVDTLIPRVNHSAAGLLGKEAFNALNSGRPISDLLSGKMLIEYLKQIENSVTGISLLSYPVTVSQAVLLEFLMTGRPIKTNFEINPDIKKFIDDELRPQPYLDMRVVVDFEDIFAPDLQQMSKDILEADPHGAMPIDQERLKLSGKPAMSPYAVDAALRLLESKIPKEGGSGATQENIQKMMTNVAHNQETQETKPQPPKRNPNEDQGGPSKEELAQRIRTETYNLGRFQAQLSQDSYEEMKALVFFLMHAERKCTHNKVAEVVASELVAEGIEIEETLQDGTLQPSKLPNQTEEKTPTIANDQYWNIVPQHNEHLRPVSYVDMLNLRTSKIMPRPNKDSMEIQYNTTSFFSKYIKCLTTAAARKEEEEFQAKKLKYEKCLEEEIPGEDCVWEPIAEENPDTYYRSHGMKEVFDYNSLDYDSITKLCRMIINEPWQVDEPLRKRSIDLFDNVALSKLKKEMPIKKKTESKKSRGGGSRKSKAGGRKSEAGGRKSRASRNSRRKSHASKRQSMNPRSSAAESKRTGQKTRRNTAEKTKAPKPLVAEEQAGEKEEVEFEEMVEAHHPPAPVPPPPKPGEYGWIYVEETIPNVYQIFMATTWEGIEFKYLSSLNRLFYLMRTHGDKVSSCQNIIRKEMESTLFNRDKRTDVLIEFQMRFKDMKPDKRLLSEVKKSLHCQIFHLYSNLTDFADAKRNNALARRKMLLNQRWGTRHLLTLANMYLYLIQVETNRSVESWQLLHDYYFAMLQKAPSDMRPEMVNIPKAYMYKRERSIVSTVEKEMPWTRQKEETKVSEYIVQIVDEIDHLLKNSAIKTIDLNPTYTLISRAIDLSMAKANELSDYYEQLILDPDLGVQLRPKVLKKLTPEEEKERKKQEKLFRKMLEKRKQKITSERRLSEGRNSSPRKIRRKRLQKSAEVEVVEVESKLKFQVDATKLQMVDRLKWEWLVAVRNEFNRLKFRLDLIARRAKVDLDETLATFKASFDEYFHDTGWQYRREIKTIEEVVEMFKAATDLSVDMPFGIDYDAFYVGGRPIDGHFDCPSPPPNSPVVVVPEEFAFSSSQLNNFIKKFEQVSSNGIIDQCFVDILEDMVVFNSEMNYEFLPPGWSALSRDDLCFLVEQTFGPYHVVNWKDFVLFCSGIRYPTVEEIIEMRERFREADEIGFETIQYQAFMRIPLWYEKELETGGDITWGQDMKNLLFQIFRASRKEINFTELLLRLCKGTRPEEGLNKALGLILGSGFEFWPDQVHSRHVVDYVLIQILDDVLLKTRFAAVTDLSKEAEEECEETTRDEYLDECNLTESSVVLKEHIEEEVEGEAEMYDKYKHILWKTYVPYEACLALLFVALRFWELPPAHLLRQLQLEKELTELFNNCGVGSHIKALKLARSKLMNDIFQKTCVFKACDVPEMVYSIVRSKSLVGAKTVLENCQRKADNCFI